ncbi:MAG: hypothetical protein WAV40_04540 [Microgenomates group bacterium]
MIAHRLENIIDRRDLSHARVDAIAAETAAAYSLLVISVNPLVGGLLVLAELSLAYYGIKRAVRAQKNLSERIV